MVSDLCAGTPPLTRICGLGAEGRASLLTRHICLSLPKAGPGAGHSLAFQLEFIPSHHFSSWGKTAQVALGHCTKGARGTKQGHIS